MLIHLNALRCFLQVSDLALVAPMSAPGSDYLGSSLVALYRADNMFLHEHVRERGGAYGAWVRYPPTGLITFLSYRDPKPANSLKIFEKTPDFLEEWAQEASKDKEKDDTIVLAMLPVISVIDMPLSIEQKGVKSFFQFIQKEGPDHRKRFREQVLTTKPEHIVDLAQQLRQAFQKVPEGVFKERGASGGVLEGGTAGAIAFIGPETAAKTIVEAGDQLQMIEVD